MDLRNCCAYNQTRECFLGLEVAERELQYLSTRELASLLALKSGEGLWLSPFTGLPASSVPVALDLIYLDKHCRVLDIVDSHPAARELPADPRTATLLVLPAHTIYTSQTLRGDQLVLCVAEEMESRLEQLARQNASPMIQDAALVREIPLWSGGPGVMEMEKRELPGAPGAGMMHEIGVDDPGKRSFRPPRNWLERWWTPDPRRAPRELDPKLAAYYWNGAAPAPHKIRDISSTGLYLVTEERWYPGTLVLMTLQRTDVGEELAERSIYVHSRAVRWGSDGVGLQFVVPDAKDPLRGREFMANSVDRKQLDRFLQKLLKRK